VIRLITRRSADTSYLSTDKALELDGVRDGPAEWRPTAGPGVDLANSPGRVRGYDIIFAAPRPFSILVAVGAEQEQQSAVRIHREAVQATLNYLEDRATLVRVSRDGNRWTRADTWRGVTSFTHGVNRWGEPHLHDHALVAARTRSGRVLDPLSLRVHLGAADAIYLASIREGLTRTTTRNAWRSFTGAEYVSGIDEGFRMLWPGHNRDRPDKVLWSREDILSQWRSDLRSYVSGPEVPERKERDFDAHSYQRQLEGRLRITRRDIIEASAHAHVRGITPEHLSSVVSTTYPELSNSFGYFEAPVSRAHALELVRSRTRQRERSRDSVERDRSR
jgi:hypothetical protein